MRAGEDAARGADRSRGCAGGAFLLGCACLWIGAAASRPAFAAAALVPSSPLDALPRIDFPTGFYGLWPAGADAETAPAKILYAYTEVSAVGDAGDVALLPQFVDSGGDFLSVDVGASDLRAGDLKAIDAAARRWRWRKGGAATIVPRPGESGAWDVALSGVGHALRFLAADEAGAAAALGLDPSKAPKTIYLAHRGSADIPWINRRGIFPGNTIGSMDAALLGGFPGFEIDLHLAKDGEFAVTHDRRLAVSTNCRGKVEERTMAELSRCDVKYTGLFPEARLFHSKAEITEKIPSLKDVLARFLPDPRLRKLTLDVKPGDVARQIAAFREAFAGYPPAQLAKLILLVRTKDISNALYAAQLTQPTYAFEGSSGWEPLDLATERGDRFFADAAANPADRGISISVGLGLGYSGGFVKAFWQTVKSLPDVVAGLFSGKGALDVDRLHWTDRNRRRFRKFVRDSQAHGITLVGWTVNGRKKIQWLRAAAPDLQYVLTDLPFRRIAKVQIAELSTGYSTAAETIAEPDEETDDATAGLNRDPAPLDARLNSRQPGAGNRP